MPIRDSEVWGVEARLERVWEVRTGVRWTCASIREYADLTDSRVSGRVLERSAMLAEGVVGVWYLRQVVACGRFG